MGATRIELAFSPGKSRKQGQRLLHTHIAFTFEDSNLTSGLMASVLSSYTMLSETVTCLELPA